MHGCLPRTTGGGGAGVCGAQADVPLAEPRAQHAFKDSMIHGVLQFALRIAFRCVLHRARTQDIHRQELFFVFQDISHTSEGSRS
jgi:hypothetical protein